MGDEATVKLAANETALNAGLQRAEQSIRGWGTKAESIAASVGKKMNASMQGIGGQVTGFLSGKLGLIGATLSLGSMAAAAGENIAAQKKLDAVLKATGNATGFSRSQMDNLAASLSKTTNNSVAANKSAMAVLATFTQIRGDQFAGALRSAEDLAAVFGTDVTSAVRQVAIALNDPIEGVMHLRRTGVIFTDEQKKQISNYYAMGDAAKAQQVILDELKKRFGGAAEGMASGMTKALNELKEAGSVVGEAVLPVFAKIAGYAASAVSAWSAFSETIGKKLAMWHLGVTEEQLKAREAALTKQQQRTAQINDLLRQRNEIDAAIPKTFGQQLEADLEPLNNMLLKIQAIRNESERLGQTGSRGEDEARTGQVRESISKVLQGKEQSLGIGGGVDSQKRQYKERLDQYNEFLGAEQSQGRSRSGKQMAEDIAAIERQLTGDVRSKAEKFSAAWDDLKEKLKATDKPASVADRALRELVDSTLSEDTDKVKKFEIELETLNAILIKSGRSAEEQARRRKALNESTFGSLAVSQIATYRNAIDELTRAEKAGMNAREAAARKSQAGKALTGEDVVTPEMAFHYANQNLSHRAADDPTFAGSDQFKLQQTKALKDYRDNSGVQSVLDSIKSPQDQLQEQLTKLADMRVGRNGFMPDSLSDTQYKQAVNKAMEGAGGGFRSSFVGGQDMWKNMASNGMSNNPQVFEIKKSNGYLVKVVAGIAKLVEATTGGEDGKKKSILKD